MNVFSVALIGVVSVLLALHLKAWKGEFGTYLVFAAGILIFCYTVYQLRDLTVLLKAIRSQLNMNDVGWGILMKMLGITYVAELASGICRDAGYGSLGSQIELFGKISILGVSLPVMKGLFDVVGSFLTGSG